MTLSAPRLILTDVGTTTPTKRRHKIRALLSLSQAAEYLGVERRYLKGYAEAMGIELRRIPPRTLAMTVGDLQRIRKRLGKPEPHAVTAAG